MKKSSNVILVIAIIFVIALVGVGVWYIIDSNNKLKNEVSELKSQQNNSIESNNIDNTDDDSVISNSTTSNNAKQYETIVAKYDIKEDDDWIYNVKNKKVAFSSDNSNERGLSITNIIKNSDNTYTIKGVVYQDYKITDSEIKELDSNGYIYIYGEKYKKDPNDVIDNNYINLVKSNSDSDCLYSINRSEKVLTLQAQWAECYKITNKHMQITVDADTLVLHANELSMEEGEGTTVAELYESKNGYTGYDDGSGSKSNVKLYNFVFKDGKCFEMYAIPYES